MQEFSDEIITNCKLVRTDKMVNDMFIFDLRFWEITEFPGTYVTMYDTIKGYPSKQNLATLLHYVCPKFRLYVSLEFMAAPDFLDWLMLTIEEFEERQSALNN